jgi:HAMP domain-containing protein
MGKTIGTGAEVDVLAKKLAKLEEDVNELAAITEQLNQGPTQGTIDSNITVTEFEALQTKVADLSKQFGAC